MKMDNSFLHNKKLLLVDDEPELLKMVCSILKDAGFVSIVTAKNCQDAVTAAKEQKPDIAILDVMLPDGDGFSLMKQLREFTDVPIIFLTARGREEDVLYGYHLGCDDYIVKPFSLAELYAKVQALIKRAKGMVACAEIVCGEIVLNPVRFTVVVNGVAIELPPKQYALLKYLMENKDRVIERELLLTRIWGYDYEGNERVVDNHVKKLRKALGTAGAQIKTVMKKGYKIAD